MALSGSVVCRGCGATKDPVRRGADAYHLRTCTGPWPAPAGCWFCRGPKNSPRVKDGRPLCTACDHLLADFQRWLRSL